MADTNTIPVTNLIPDKIGRYNAYVGDVDVANKLIGITAEMTLPSFSYMSETLSLSGTAGEIDSPAEGQLQSAETEIPFTNISEQALTLAANDSKALVLRAEQEFIDKTTYEKKKKSRVITIRGFTKKINFGSLKKAGYGNPSITKEIIYYKEIVDGVTVFEVDKLNGTPFVINGENMAAENDSMI